MDVMRTCSFLASLFFAVLFACDPEGLSPFVGVSFGVVAGAWLAITITDWGK